jgi:hypothetical protein
MPFGDGTGPSGLGPMTGRAAGFCAGSGRPGFASRMRGYPYQHGDPPATQTWPRWSWGLGHGLGRGLGRGSGRSWRRWGSYGYPRW